MFPSLRAVVLTHGDRRSFSFPVTAAKDVGCIYSLKLNWVYRGNYMNPGSYCTWWTDCNSAIFVESVAVAIPDNQME
jgi:hypothetical protein